MKLLHTSDWHLGAKLHEQDRAGDHAAFLRWLGDVVRTESPDVLLITGDIFDMRQPGPAAQSLYYDFIAAIARSTVCRKIVVTAGNHDSAAMLAAADQVLKRLDVEVVAKATSEGNGEVVTVEGTDGQTALAIAAVPFMNDGELSNFAREAGVTAETTAEKLAGGFSSHYAKVIAAAHEAAQGAPVVVTGHCTIRGAQVSDERSERGRQIGGLDSQEPDVFASADYVALGHLHIPQDVGTSGKIRYSGSPLAMSFSEIDQEKSVTIVEFGSSAGDAISARKIPVPEFTLLKCLEGATDAVRTALLAVKAGNPELAYVAVRITEGEGELAPFWSELDTIVQGTGIRILLKENARKRAVAGSGLSAAAEKTLSAMTPQEVAELRINEETDLTAEERAEYVKMVHDVIGGLA